MKKKSLSLFFATILSVLSPNASFSQATTKLDIGGESALDVGYRRMQLEQQSSNKSHEDRQSSAENVKGSEPHMMDSWWGNTVSEWSWNLTFFSKNENGSVTYRCNPGPDPSVTTLFNFMNDRLILVYEIYEGTYGLRSLYQKCIDAYGMPNKSYIDDFGNTNYNWFVGNTKITLGPMEGNVLVDYEPISMPAPKVQTTDCFYGPCSAFDKTTGLKCGGCRMERESTCYKHK